jgi:lipooligosaccharide transport system permease protein
MFLFSATFFPVETLPGWAQHMAAILPLTHLVNLARTFATGRIDASIVAGILYLIGFTLVALPVAIVSMRRRLIK